MYIAYQFHDQTLDRSQSASRLKALALDGLWQNYPEQPGHLEGDEARYAAAWLGELRRRLDRIYEQMPEDFSSVNFEYWMERCMDLSEQITLLERLLHG